jgi:uncharacterized protein with HEPN domain
MPRSKLSSRARAGAFLKDILVEAAEIDEFVRHMNLATFVEDRLTRKAVTKNLESIGEATKNLPAALKARHTQIRWDRIAGFRDIAAHHYWEVDYAIVWDAARNHLPEVVAVAKEELARLK